MTKNGTSCSPASMSTSPDCIRRTCPCAAIRSICGAVKVGNIRSVPDAWVNGAMTVLEFVGVAAISVSTIFISLTYTSPRVVYSSSLTN